MARAPPPYTRRAARAGEGQDEACSELRQAEPLRAVVRTKASGVLVRSSMAVLNTNICTAASLIVWTCLDVVFFKKPSVVGAVQAVITGLVCITPGAGTYCKYFSSSVPVPSIVLHAWHGACSTFRVRYEVDLASLHSKLSALQ